MNADLTTPSKAAIRLSHLLDTFCTTHGIDRFPVDVERLALDCAETFDWPDPITEIKSANIKNFEGCLYPSEKKDRWLLLYNNMLSPGRIRFTQAHELGHYILHRSFKDSFECTNEDMLNWSEDEKDLEAQADRFSSYLLMPLNDYRKQTNSTINLELFSHCADRYGVSLTAAILKWLDYTDKKAILILSTDGFMNWAWSSKPAYKAGAFFRTRKNVIPIPADSLTANGNIRNEKIGKEIPLTTWFKHGEKESVVREMKVESSLYGSTITLLVLPSDTNVWPPRDI